jgi:hypothetical protein
MNFYKVQLYITEYTNANEFHNIIEIKYIIIHTQS